MAEPVFNTREGPKTVSQLRDELRRAQYPNWERASPDELFNVYQNVKTNGSTQANGLDFTRIAQDARATAMKALRDAGINVGLGVDPFAKFLIGMGQKQVLGKTIEQLWGGGGYNPENLIGGVTDYYRRLSGRDYNVFNENATVREALRAIGDFIGSASGPEALQQATMIGGRPMTDQLRGLIAQIAESPDFQANAYLSAMPYTPFASSYENYIQSLLQPYYESLPRGTNQINNFLGYLLRRV